MEEKKKEVKQAEEKIPKTEEIKENKKEEAKEKKNDKKQENVKQQEKTKNEEQTAQQAKPVNTETESTTKKRKTRKKLVLAVLAIALLIIYIVERGEFLEIKEIGENYISMFWQNMKYRGIAAVVNFLAIFTLTYTTTTKVKRGLKVFFEDEKKEMPKLPQKSISFIFATLVTIGTTGMIVEKALPCFFNTQFVTTDPALGLDIGFFVFILPFLKFITIYALVAMIAAVVYATLYYLIVFNICFDGILRESVKKSGLLNNALGYLKVIIVLFAILMLIGTLDIGVQKFIVLNNDESENYSIFGAGITETTIGFWGYIALSVIMIVSVFKAIKEFKKERRFPAWRWYEYTVPASQNKYIIFFYVESRAFIEKPEIGNYCVVFDNKNNRFVIKWGACGYNHTKDGPLMLLRQIQVYTSHFFDRYKERCLKDLSLNANDVVCRYLSRNKEVMPIEMNNEINRHLDQYGAGAKYGFRVRDGFCFALLDLQVMQSKDGDCEKDKPQAMYVVYKTFMNEADMADTQLSAIDKSHYDAWLRYIQTLQKEATDGKITLTLDA